MNTKTDTHFKIEAVVLKYFFVEICNFGLNGIP